MPGFSAELSTNGGKRLKRRRKQAGINPAPAGERRELKEAKLETRKFIEKNHAVPPILTRDVDRRLFETAGASQGAMPAPVFARQILVYHESQPAEAGNDWMYKLKDQSMRFLADQRGQALSNLQQEAQHKRGIETLIDKIYGLLQRYTYEFNKIAAGTDLYVSGTISGDVTEVTRYNKMREVEETKTYFRARVSTRLYSLVFRGKDDCVEVYLLPINKIMALSQSEVEYKPLARIQVKITAQGMMWRMENGKPAVNSLNELCKWFFSNLIEKTKHSSAHKHEPIS